MTKRMFDKSQLSDPFSASPKTPIAQADLHPQTQMEPNPRPWHVGFGADSDSAYYIVSADGKIVAELDTHSSIADSQNADRIVRAVDSFDDLYEACKAVAGVFEGQEDAPMYARRAIIAVAKAEGKQ